LIDSRPLYRKKIAREMYTPTVPEFCQPSNLVPRSRPSSPPYRKHGYYGRAPSLLPKPSGPSTSRAAHRSPQARARPQPSRHCRSRRARTAGHMAPPWQRRPQSNRVSGSEAQERAASCERLKKFTSLRRWPAARQRRGMRWAGPRAMRRSWNCAWPHGARA
jgi:hypothetical protein